MKSFGIAICLAGAFITGAATSPARAQEPASNATPSQATPARAADPGNRADTTPKINDAGVALNGVSLVAEITKSVNSKKAKPGDEVKARLAQDLLLKGTVVLPRQSELVGHVSEVKAHTKEEPEARLGVVFDRALLKNGKQIEMSAVLQALAPAVATAIDAQDPMIQQANDRTARMLPHLDSGIGSNRNMTDSSARSPQINTKISKDGKNVTKEDSSIPWTPGSRLDSGNRGVFGFPDLALTTTAGNPALTSQKNDIKLEGGTQIVLKVVSGIQ